MSEAANVFLKVANGPFFLIRETSAIASKTRLRPSSKYLSRSFFEDYHVDTTTLVDSEKKAILHFTVVLFLLLDNPSVSS